MDDQNEITARSEVSQPVSVIGSAIITLFRLETRFEEFCKQCRVQTHFRSLLTVKCTFVILSALYEEYRLNKNKKSFYEELLFSLHLCPTEEENETYCLSKTQTQGLSLTMQALCH